MLFDDLEIRQRHPEWSKPVDTELPGRYESSRHYRLEQRRRSKNLPRRIASPNLFRRKRFASEVLTKRFRCLAEILLQISAALLRLPYARSLRR